MGASRSPAQETKSAYDRARYLEHGGAAGHRETCKGCARPKGPGVGRRLCDPCRAEARERKREYMATYYANNAHARERQARYVAATPNRQREYRAANPDIIRAQGRVNARRRKARKRGVRQGDPRLIREYEAILRRDPCSYCGGPADHADHIDPIRTGGDDAWDNLTGACASCNSSKRTRPLLAFMGGP